MTEEEIKEMRKNKKKILFKGHKKTNISSCWWTLRPLAMGGEDDVENLSCTCYPYNLFKGNILPSDFYGKNNGYISVSDGKAHVLVPRHYRNIKECVLGAKTSENFR